MQVPLSSVRNNYEIFLFFLHSPRPIAAVSSLSLPDFSQGLSGITGDVCSSAQAGTIVAKASFDKNVDKT